MKAVGHKEQGHVFFLIRALFFCFFDRVYFLFGVYLHILIPTKNNVT